MTNKLFIWDLPVRLFHWLLVISLASAWYTSDGEKGLIDYHLKIGYFILGLIVFRIFWGFWGTKYAKFSQFIPTKTKLISYLQKSKQDKNYTTIGHNPLGGLMVVLMLLLIILQTVSGLFMNDDVFTTGPYYESVSSATQKFMSLIHRNIFDIILITSILHISAILYYLLAKKINLIIPMLTGYKLSKEDQGNAITSSKLLLAVVMILVVAVFLYWLLVLNIPVEDEFYY